MTDTKKPVGSYSAIVYKEGDLLIAEDYRGKKIAEGEAGVDDGSVLQTAIANMNGYDRLEIRSELNISSEITVGKPVIISGGRIKVDSAYTGSLFKITNNTSDTRFPLIMESIEMYSESEGSWKAIELNPPSSVGMWNLLFIGVKIVNPSVGIYVNPQSWVTGTDFIGCLIKGAEYFIEINGKTNGVKFNNCEFQHTRATPVTIMKLDSDGGHNYHFINCSFWNDGSGDITYIDHSLITVASRRRYMIVVGGRWEIPDLYEAIRQGILFYGEYFEKIGTDSHIFPATPVPTSKNLVTASPDTWYLVGGATVTELTETYLGETVYRITSPAGNVSHAVFRFQDHYPQELSQNVPCVSASVFYRTVSTQTIIVYLQATDGSNYEVASREINDVMKDGNWHLVTLQLDVSKITFTPTDIQFGVKIDNSTGSADETIDIIKPNVVIGSKVPIFPF